MDPNSRRSEARARHRMQWLMPVELTGYDSSPLCQGSHWAVRDPDLLARSVAALLLGEHRHGASLTDRLAAGLHLAAAPTSVDHIIRVLTIPADSARNQQDAARWHRDGLVFQLISWVVATKSAPADTLVRMPHVRPADKGLDGLQLQPPTGERVYWVAVVCEDKATERPRRMVRDEVWPEFTAFESGQRDHELRADVGAMAERIASTEERERLISDVLWPKQLWFRVCVTVDPECDCDGSIRGLFGGYQNIVSGDLVARRRAETLPLEVGVRGWMDEFCERVVTELRSLTTPPLDSEPNGVR